MKKETKPMSNSNVRQKIYQIEQNFKSTCLSSGQPLSYCTLFLNSLAKKQFTNQDEELQIKTQLITDQINLLKKKESFSQHMSNLVCQRQQIIRHLRSELILNRNAKQHNLKTSCQKIDQIRKLTLAILQNLQKSAIRFRVQNSEFSTQIMKKIIQGTDFLKFTSLRKHIQFSNHDDPLFLIPLKKLKNLQLTSDYNRKPVIDLFSVSEQFQTRLQNADIFLKYSLQERNKTSQSKKKQTQNEGLDSLVLPTIQNRNRQRSSIISSKEPQYTHFSSMIKRIIEDSAIKQKIKRRDNIFNPKKRSRTETDQYLQKDQSQTKKSYYQLGIPENGPRSLSKRIQTLTQDGDTDHNYQYKFNQKYKIAFKIDESGDQLKALKSKRRNIKNDNTTQRDQFNLQKSNINELQNKQTIQGQIIIAPQITVKVKNKLSKIRNKKISKELQYQTYKQTIYKQQEDQVKQQILREEPTDSNWSKFYRTQTKKEFSPKIQQKINHIQNLSKNFNQSMSNNQSATLQNVLQQNQDIYTQRLQQTIRYKNPLDQLKTPPKQHQIQPTNNQVIQEQHKEKTYVKSNTINFIDQSLFVNQSQHEIQSELQQPNFPNGRSLSIKSNKNQDNKEIVYYDNKSQAFNKTGNLQKIPNLPNKNNPKNIPINLNISNSQSPSKKIPQKQPNQPIISNTKTDNLNSNIPNEAKKQEIIQKKQDISNKSMIKSTHNKTFTQFYVDSNGKFSASKYISPLQKLPEDQEILSQAYKNTTPYSTIKKYQPTNSKEEQLSPKIHSFLPQSINPIQEVPQQFNQQTPTKIDKSIKNSPNYSKQLKNLKNSYDNKVTLLQKNNSLSPNNEKLSNSNIILKQPKQMQKVSPQLNFNQKQFPPKKKVNVITQEFGFQQIGSITAKKQQAQKPELEVSKNKMSYQQNIKNETKVTQNKGRQMIPNKQAKIPLSILQKCVFQSKSMQQSEMLSQLKDLNRQSFRHLQPYITTNYFKNRHIILTNCYFNQQMACYCLYYPYLINQVRFIFILHIEVRQKFSQLQSSLINTFVKYIFCNDPANKIIFLKHKQLFLQQFIESFKDQTNFVGEVKTPIKGSQLAQRSYLFQRKQLNCNKQQEFTTIFNTIFLLAASPKDISITAPKQRDLYFSSSFLKKLQNTLKKRQAKLYRNYNQLTSYLQEQRLPQFKSCSRTSQIMFYSQFLQDCLVNVRYFVYSKYFYFTIQPPYTFLYQNEDVYYLFLSTSVEKKYFVIADKIFQETEHIDFNSDFRENILNKNFNQIIKNEKRKGAIVGCPQFKKQAQFSLGNGVSAIMNLQLNWKEYIKGVKYLPEQKVEIEFIGPFFCGLVQVDEDNLITHLYSAIINERDIIK